MITEDYVSFETAKLLKEKGFNEPCSSYFISDNEIGLISVRQDFNDYGVYLSAPTLQMARKWLKEVHDIDVSIVPLRSHKEYLPRIEGNITSHDATPCKKYEEAAEMAIKYTLENLI